MRTALCNVSITWWQDSSVVEYLSKDQKSVVQTSATAFCCGGQAVYLHLTPPAARYRGLLYREHMHSRCNKHQTNIFRSILNQKYRRQISTQVPKIRNIALLQLNRDIFGIEYIDPALRWITNLPMNLFYLYIYYIFLSKLHFQFQQISAETVWRCRSV